MTLAALDPRGPIAWAIDDLWRLMLWLGVATFVVFAAVLSRGLVRSGESNGDGADRGSLLLVGGGIVLSVVVIGVVFVSTVATMRALAAPRDDPVVIEVTGHQWWWEVRHLDPPAVTANGIVVPTGRPVELRLTSADVIHSFWVPSLAGKTDALPDGVNTLVLEAPSPVSIEAHARSSVGSSTPGRV